MQFNSIHNPKKSFPVTVPVIMLCSLIHVYATCTLSVTGSNVAAINDTVALTTIN